MSAKKLINTIQEVAWHRNGIGGTGFYAVRFTMDLDPVSEEEAKLWNIPATPGETNANFLAIVFNDPGKCAVICLDHIASHGVAFGRNSWRGDRYEAELRQAIDKTPTSGGVRVGPFILPTEPMG